jgi:hypothetical protein
MKVIRLLSVVVVSAICATGSAVAQGSIFGAVSNADQGSPSQANMVFFGYLRGSDNEIRICGSDGIDYENGNWWDDFQNFLDEAPGVQYDYWFFDRGRSEWQNLQDLVPANSFQQQDVQLTAGSFPSPPNNIEISVGLDNSVRLAWQLQTGLQYHIFRRPATSHGSFYRIDDASGDVSGGVNDSVYIDPEVTDPYDVEYVVIATDGWVLSPPSQIVSAVQGGCCIGMTGNVDGDVEDLVDISDITQLIDYLYISRQPLPCPAEANMDGDSEGLVDLADLTYLINYLWIERRPLAPCQ